MATPNTMYDGMTMPMDGHMGHDEMVGATKGSHRTVDEIMSNLANHDMMDELHICNKYLDYSECFYNRGEEEICKIFVEMAWEEYTHAKYQKELLLGHGYSLDENSSNMFHETKERFKAIFR